MKSNQNGSERMKGTPAVLFEGGTFRPVFSCGVMDALLDEKYYVSLLYRVSAKVPMRHHIFPDREDVI